MAPPSHQNALSAAAIWEHMFPGYGVGGAELKDADAVLSSLFRRQFAGSARPALDGVVVSLGGNALTSQMAPHAVVHGHEAAITKVTTNVKWLLAGVAAYAAPQSTIVLLSAVPRAHLSGADLAAYRTLTNSRSGGAGSSLRL